MSTASTAAPAVPTPSSVAELSDTAPADGRLAILTALAVASRAIPVPFVPDRVLHRIRGAAAHDVASRHGLSLTSDARDALAEPNPDKRTTLLARKLAESVTNRLLRRFGPFGRISSVLRALEVFALGHLFERYLRDVRPKGAVRMHVEEARALRDAIDRAVLRTLSPSLEPRGVTLPGPAEDLRDEFTRWIDAVLLTGASLPGYVERRLDAAFDAVVAEHPELRHG
jgi:hypothetical protein